MTAASARPGVVAPPLVVFGAASVDLGLLRRVGVAFSRIDVLCESESQIVDARAAHAGQPGSAGGASGAGSGGGSGSGFGFGFGGGSGPGPVSGSVPVPVRVSEVPTADLASAIVYAASVGAPAVVVTPAVLDAANSEALRFAAAAAGHRQVAAIVLLAADDAQSGDTSAHAGAAGVAGSTAATGAPGEHLPGDAPLSALDALLAESFSGINHVRWTLLDCTSAADGPAAGVAIAELVEAFIRVQEALTLEPAFAAADPQTNAPVAPDETAAPPAASVPFKASDIVHVRLTGDAIEATNRTSRRLRLAVFAGEGESVALEPIAEVELEPGAARALPVSHVPQLAALAAPEEVLRHWSHGSERVFEGGERRIHALEIEYLSDDGASLGRRRHDVAAGFEVAVTARALTRDLAALEAEVVAAPQAVPDARGSAAEQKSRHPLARLARAFAIGGAALALEVSFLSPPR